ncbi:Homeodomain-like protein, partial [Pavlovales sp. CCMP2436]
RLFALVEQHGPRKWSLIAQSFEHRLGKQCRERWVQHLMPSVRKGAWTDEEDRLIMEGVARLGTRWNLIAKV